MCGGTHDVLGCYIPWSQPSSAYPVYYYVPQEPSFCMGKAHVFACDHERHCLCGKIERANVANP
jgi:hypothetical protein